MVVNFWNSISLKVWALSVSILMAQIPSSAYLLVTNPEFPLGALCSSNLCFEQAKQIAAFL